MRKSLVAILAPVIVVSLFLAACAPAAAPSPTAAPASAKTAPAAAAPAASAPAVAPASAPAKANTLDSLYEAAKKEGEVIWQAGRPAADFAAFADLFQKRFPGMKLTIVSTQPPQIAQRLITESQAKQVTIDVGTGGIQHVMPLLDRDIILAQDYASMGIDPKDIALDNKLVMTRDQATDFIYNTKLIPDKNALSNWDDLLNPKYQGKIVVGRSGQGWEALASQLDDAKFLDFVTQFAKQKPVGTTESPAPLIGSGEYAIALVSVDQALTQKEQGAPLEIPPMKSLYTLPIFNFLVKGSPHPNAAKLFVAWANTAEAKAELAKAQWGPIAPCGPTKVEQWMCGKTEPVFRLDTIEKAQRSDKLRPQVVKILGFTTQ